MKKIGIVGFTLSSNIEYYRHIVHRYQEELDNENYPEIVIDMLNVSKVHHLGSTGRYEEFIDYICGAIRNLEKSGAHIGMIASNTPHMFFEDIQGKVNIPLVNVVEETCHVVKEKRIKNIGLLGTIFTMEHDFYKTPFIDSGIDVVVPGREDREFLQRIILDELAKEIYKEETIAKVYAIIEKLKKENGIEGLILGCTEFPLIVEEEKAGILCFDTLKIHVDGLIKRLQS